MCDVKKYFLLIFILKIKLLSFQFAIRGSQKRIQLYSLKCKNSLNRTNIILKNFNKTF